MNTYQFVLPAAMPQFIPVADRPLNLGGVITHISLQDFHKHFNCVYSEGVSIEFGKSIPRFQESISGFVSAARLTQQVRDVLASTNENLVLCNMGQLGHGVFVAKAIPKDRVVAICSGTIIHGQKTVIQDHAYGYCQSELSISTKNYRGIASFMQHLPEEPMFKNVQQLSMMLASYGQTCSEQELKLNIELYSTTFDSAQTRVLIAIENIWQEYLNIDGVPVIAMVTTRDIGPGEQLGFNYSYTYWAARALAPEFFDRDGNVLSHTVYKRTFGRLCFDEFVYTGAYKPLIDSLKQGKMSVSVIGDDERSHCISAAHLLCALVVVNACSVTCYL